MRAVGLGVLVFASFAAGWTLRSIGSRHAELAVEGVVQAPAPAALPAPEPAPPPLAGCRLSGTLCDGDGRALEGVKLTLAPCPSARASAAWGGRLSALDAGVEREETRCDPQGGFSFEGVPAGGWALLVQGGPALPPAVYTFRLSEDQCAVHKTLVLPLGLGITGRVLDAAGVPGAAIELRAIGLDQSFSARGQSDALGRFALGPLIPGCYRVEAWSGGRASASRIVCTGEDPLELLLSEGAQAPTRQ